VLSLALPQTLLGRPEFIFAGECELNFFSFSVLSLSWVFRVWMSFDGFRYEFLLWVYFKFWKMS